MSWSTVIGEFLKLINNLFINPKKQIEKVINIYDAMHRILAETNVERLLILRAHNGGGVIKPTGELYASVLYEDYLYPFHSVKSDYQKLPVDKEYAKMLLKVMQEKHVSYKVADMDENSILRKVYESEGVRYSNIYYIGQDKTNIYYCSTATSLDFDNWLSRVDQTVVEICMNIIRQNIK